MAAVAKALGDPIRLQLVDVLRKHAGKVCVYELVPLFDISQPTLSHHLKKLRDVGNRGLRTPRTVGVLLRQAGRPAGADRVAGLTDERQRANTRESAKGLSRRCRYQDYEPPTGRLLSFPERQRTSSTGTRPRRR